MSMLSQCVSLILLVQVYAIGPSFLRAVLYSLFWSACVVRHSQARGSVDEQWERPLFWADQIFPVAPIEETRKEQLVELKSHPLKPQAPLLSTVLPTKGPSL